VSDRDVAYSQGRHRVPKSGLMNYTVEMTLSFPWLYKQPKVTTLQGS